MFRSLFNVMTLGLALLGYAMGNAGDPGLRLVFLVVLALLYGSAVFLSYFRLHTTGEVVKCIEGLCAKHRAQAEAGSLEEGR